MTDGAGLEGSPRRPGWCPLCRTWQPSVQFWQPADPASLVRVQCAGGCLGSVPVDRIGGRCHARYSTAASMASEDDA